MPFSTQSYMAGVGTVIAAITIGFSGGFFLAPNDRVEQNRLQRVTSSAPISNPAPQTAVTPKLDVAEANAAPAPAIQPPARMIPVMAKAVEPPPSPAAPKAAEPVRGAFEQDRATQPNSERMRAAEARAERKLAREQRRAERRKQREIELASVGIRRMLRDRDPQQVADRTESPRFGFFGED